MTGNPYDSLLAYFAYFTVNHDLPIVPVNPGAVEDPNSDARRVKGSLSSLFFAFCSGKKQQIFKFVV